MYFNTSIIFIMLYHYKIGEGLIDTKHERVNREEKEISLSRLLRPTTASQYRQ